MGTVIWSGQYEKKIGRKNKTRVLKFLTMHKQHSAGNPAQSPTFTTFDFFSSHLIEKTLFPPPQAIYRLSSSSHPTMRLTRPHLKFVNVLKRHPPPPSKYAQHMKRLSAAIFTEWQDEPNYRALRVYRQFSEPPVNKRAEVVRWYPHHPTWNKLINQLRSYGLYRDEHEDFLEEMERLRKLRGKGRVNIQEKLKSRSGRMSGYE